MCIYVCTYVIDNTQICVFIYMHIYVCVCVCIYMYVYITSQVVLVIKGSSDTAGDLRDMSLISGWEDPLEEGMAAHSSVLTWRIPWTEESGGL